MVKQADSFRFIYSFATRSQNAGLREYYISQLNDLFTLGDYGYRLVRDVYVKFCNPMHTLPLAVGKQHYPSRPHLKLITNPANVRS